MATGEILNFGELLAPISDAAPSGEDLRSKGDEFARLKQVRARARQVERKKSEQDPEYADLAPEWSPILQQAPALLQSRSKDLELATWLTEALVREHGFAGLRDGIRLLRELTEKFWDTLYPLPDADGVGARAGRIAGLSGDAAEGTLIEPLRRIPIIRSRDDGFCVADYKQASDLQSMAEESRRRRVDAGALTLARLQQAAAQTPPAFFRQLLEDVAACRVECRQLESALAERCGPDADGNPTAPSCANIVAVLDMVAEAVQAVGGSRAAAAAAAPAAEALTAGNSDRPPVAAADADAPADGAAPSLIPMGMPANRDAAFEQILLIAAFFRRNEPQSVVSYALEQAVKWGRMPLPELVARFVPESGARTRFNWIGVVEPRPSEGGSASTGVAETPVSEEPPEEPAPTGAAAFLGKK